MIIGRFGTDNSKADAVEDTIQAMLKQWAGIDFATDETDEQKRSAAMMAIRAVCDYFGGEIIETLCRDKGHDFDVMAEFDRNPGRMEAVSVVCKRCGTWWPVKERSSRRLP